MRTATIPTHSRTVSNGGAPIAHRSSHAGLLRDGSTVRVPADRSRHGRPDAIIVPATRPASALNGVIDLAAASGATIVALCSKQAKTDQVAERIGRTIGARGVVVQIDDGYALPGLDFETSSQTFTAVSGGRVSDLSVKRNVGLLLARLQGWRKIVFVDDDITLSGQDISRLAYQLDSHQIAGMACRDFPDNSVFCHARRLAGTQQDVFVTGAVLGVNCGDLPLPFFPDVYNEDWFFFAEAAAHRRLTKVGEARQARYDPFSRATRAAHEEFGDLLAEGLYSFIENPPVTIEKRYPERFLPKLIGMANEKYWESFIHGRRDGLCKTLTRLQDFTRRGNCSDQVFEAIESLKAADGRYDGTEAPITPRRCVDFLEAWQRDLRTWNRVYQGTNNLLGVDVALKELGIAASAIVP